MKNIVYRVDDNGCWINKSHTPLHYDTYGRIHRDGRWIHLHRFMYTLSKGEIPKGLVVRHTCDVKQCINPDHLIIGTHKDNYNDYMTRHGNRRLAEKYIEKWNLKHPHNQI